MSSVGEAGLRTASEDWTGRVWQEAAATLAHSLVPGDRFVVQTGDSLRTALALRAALTVPCTAVLVDHRLPVELKRERIASVEPTALYDSRSGSLERWSDPVSLLDPAGLWVFTSGTTGQPRAACLSWEALTSSAAGVVDVTGLGPGDCWLSPLPLCHVGGVGVVLRCLAADAVAELWDRFDPDSLVSRLRSGEVTHLSLVPRMLERLLGSASDELEGTALRWVLVGGGAVPPSLVARARGAGIPAVPTYGLTEAASTVTLHRADEALLGPGDAGWPLPGRRLRIVDPGLDGIGEIAVGGSVLAHRYWGGGDAAPLVQDGWLATGDFGRVAGDGRLVVADRRSDLIVSGGENVYPAALETRLSELPMIEEVCVLGLPDASWGQQVVAVLRFASGAGGALEEVQGWCRENLSAWECPRRWEVRALPLPRNRLGKLQRRALRDELLP